MTPDELIAFVAETFDANGTKARTGPPGQDSVLQAVLDVITQ